MSKQTTGKQSPARAKNYDRLPQTFDVTQVIGTVSLGEDGELSPHMAAYQVIDRHDTPGTFTFPNMHGGDTTVTVDAPPQNDVGADIDNYADMDD